MRLYNGKLYNLYSSTSIPRVITSRMRLEGHVARMGKRRAANTALVGKPDGIGPLGRPTRRLDNNIKMNPQEIEWGWGLD